MAHYFARVALERAKAAPGTEYYYAGRGMPELSEEEFNLVMKFDKMNQGDRLAVIVGGVRKIQNDAFQKAEDELYHRYKVGDITLTEYLEQYQTLCQEAHHG